MASNSQGNNTAWVQIVAALIGAAGLIIAAYITGTRAGESQGQQQAFATATINQATSIASIQQQPTQFVEATRIVEVTRIVQITNTPQATLTATPTLPTPTSTTIPPTPTVVPALYQADWSGGANGWSGLGWNSVGSQLVNDGRSSEPSFVTAPFDLGEITDYAVEAEIQFVRNNEGGSYPFFGIFARSKGSTEGYLAAFQTTNGPALYLTQIEEAPFSDRLANKRLAIDTNWHTYRLEVQGNTLRLFMDGSLFLETTDNSFLNAGQAGLASYGTEINVRSFKIMKI